MRFALRRHTTPGIPNFDARQTVLFLAIFFGQRDDCENIAVLFVVFNAVRQQVEQDLFDLAAIRFQQKAGVAVGVECHAAIRGLITHHVKAFEDQFADVER